MKKIKLRNGGYVILDDDWAEMLKYVYMRKSSLGYVTSPIKIKKMGQKYKYIQKTESIHRIIMDAKPGQHIDHINRNPLDNRRCNLRFCTRSQNMANVATYKFNKSSKYKGVSDTKRSLTKRWVAQIKVNKKAVWRKYFLTENQAAIAYNKMALKLYGEFAFLNKIIQ